MKSKVIVKSMLFALCLSVCTSSAFAMGKKPRDPKKEKQLTIEKIQEKTSQTQFKNGRKKKRPLPVYLSELSNINDYCIFANGGWDGSWYVGYNVCWIEKLPPAPKGKYRKAFIGTKLGRMKTIKPSGKPAWEREPIPGEIYMSLSSSPSWKASQNYFLTDTEDIPIEPDTANALEGAGESRWFWTEVPLEEVDFKNPNYLAVWSPTAYFVSTASSPVLAGGWGSKNLNSWLNNEIKGAPPAPPIDPKESLKTGITVFEPAIAMKLIPADTEQHIEVSIDDILDGRTKTSNKTFVVSVVGDSIEKVWLEVYIDDLWQKHNCFVYTPPYFFTLKAADLPKGRVVVRAVANDIWGNIGISESITIRVSHK
ncbi:MAG: hypothetical protein JW871_00890 [Endomicrobiales bacterium]|nr:hypothetical protein [Endomicrobiales bacterium]